MVRRFERGWYVLIGLTLTSMAAFAIGQGHTTWNVARVLCALGALGAAWSVVTTNHKLERLSLVAFPFLARACLFAANPSLLGGHREVTGVLVNLTLGAGVVLLQIAWDCEDWIGGGGQ